MITQLIDKQDSFEIIRDKIGLILAQETANQQALATADGQNPKNWKLRVYAERSNPWEMFLNSQADRSPLVNVWFDSASYDMSAGNAVERQKATMTYNIDVYGFGISADAEGGGHKAGDKAASLEAQRALRLCRNIVMAGENTYLQLRGLVWSRRIQSLTLFQPPIERPVHQIIGGRIALQVVANEFSPQVEPVELEAISVDVKRAADGGIIAEAEYDYTEGA